MNESRVTVVVCGAGESGSGGAGGSVAGAEKSRGCEREETRR